MRSTQKLFRAVLPLVIVWLAAPCGCMCGPGAGWHYGSHYAGRCHFSHHAAAAACKPAIPIGYYPTTWWPLPGAYVQPPYEPDAYKPEAPEELPPGLEAPQTQPAPDAPASAPTEPEESSPDGA